MKDLNFSRLSKKILISLDFFKSIFFYQAEKNQTFLTRR
jgi:hypothetical protein